MRAERRVRVVEALLCAGVALWAGAAAAADAPDWLRAAAAQPPRVYDEDTPAVLLHAETTLAVRADGRARRLERRAYRILRTEGQAFALVRVDFDPRSRVLDLRGWSLPSGGKPYAVGMRDAIETSLPGVLNGELVSDVRAKVVQIPAAAPGVVVGYEYEQELAPDDLNDEWHFQAPVPVVEASYAVQLPEGWNARATWLNHEAVAAEDSVQRNVRQLRWSVRDVPAIAIEDDMPPWPGVASHMVLALDAPGGRTTGWTTWRDLGRWYETLNQPQRAPSDAIRAQVAALTADERIPLARVRAIARFVQTDIRYVAIELGIGGHQAHPAATVYANRFGDCKDKVTLLASMLQLVGIESHLVTVNTTRGTVSPDRPPSRAFNHAIAAIRLPDGMDDPTLLATVVHPRLGRLLYFDPTDPLTPLGRLPGMLQASYGLLTGPDGGELLPLPQLAPSTSGVRRTGSFVLEPNGTLSGDVVEIYDGDAAARERSRLRSASGNGERIKPVEARVARSLANFTIVKAGLLNAVAVDKPIEWHYSLTAERYARSAGDLLLVRPRALGEQSSALLETRKPRRHPIEFDGPRRDTDVYEYALPAGYTVDELPAPVDIDHGFASYRSRVETIGGKLRYTRTLEIKELSVPVARSEELRQFYRAIAGDERRTVVLKRP